MEPLDAARDLFELRFPDAVAGFLGGSVLTRYWLDTGKWLSRRLTGIDPAPAGRLITAHLAAVAHQDSQPLQQLTAEILDRVDGHCGMGSMHPAALSSDRDRLMSMAVQMGAR